MTRATADQQRRLLDDAVPRFITVIDRWASLPEQPRDFRDVTAAWDLRNYVLPAEVRKRLAADRKEADRQYDAQDWPGAILYYNKTFATADAVAQRFRAVHAYWFFTATWPKQKQAWSTALQRYSFQGPQATRHGELEKSLTAHVSQGDFIAAQRQALEPLRDTFEQSVQALRQHSGELVLSPDPLRRAPIKPCTLSGAVNPDGGTSVTSQGPRLDLRRSRDASRFYPRNAMLYGMIGNAKVRAWIAETGCAAGAEIVTSSGHWRLDEAALEYAVDGGAYLPGELDGRPVAATLEYVVRFKIVQP